MQTIHSQQQLLLALRESRLASEPHFNWCINVQQFPFQKSVSQATRFVHDYAKKVIQERQEAILRGDDAHILSLAEAEPSLTLEDMVDEFVIFNVIVQFHFFMYFNSPGLRFSNPD